ncbi:hypothetical protein TIFTF001_053176 [Ficus carica]|uniref:Uncharacterized protein n=1 Tax=Ficus carica TaxID=3494 RepID=A0AA88JJC0_FICCA|nr:hypothetical protein TIFTF001_053176 [Ficus carica]
MNTCSSVFRQGRSDRSRSGRSGKPASSLAHWFSVWTGLTGPGQAGPENQRAQVCAEPA